MEPPAVLRLSRALYGGVEPPVPKVPRGQCVRTRAKTEEGLSQLSSKGEKVQFRVCLRIPRSFARADRAYQNRGSFRTEDTSAGSPWTCCPYEESRTEPKESSTPPCAVNYLCGLGGSRVYQKATVAVESLLGFVAVGDLLALSQTAGTARSDDPAAPLGRLLRWLWHAAHFTEKDEAQGLAANGIKDGEVNEGSTPLSGVLSQNFAVVYQCETGEGWISYVLAPQDKSPALVPCRPMFEDSAAQVLMLELQLVCHPLITVAPDLRWCMRLIGQSRAVARLINASAVLSTLGGGYFLTRQVGQAILLARTQQQVASKLGDTHLQGKCRVNEGYNYIWIGKYTLARKIISQEATNACSSGDRDLEAYASTALLFLQRARAFNTRQRTKQGEEACGVEGQGGGRARGRGRGGATAAGAVYIDPKLDNFHRVRALCV